MLALLSNVTAETLAAAVSDATGEKVWAPLGYNTWAQELISAGFGGEGPEAVFLVLDGLRLFGDHLPDDMEEAEQILDSSLSVILNFKEKNPQAALFVSSLDIPQVKILPMVSCRIEQKAASYWRGQLECKGIPVLEIAELAADMGREKFYSSRVWYLGSVPYSMSGQKAVAGEICRALKAMRGSRAKCIALDLDGTLWGGVVGEDGTGGIELAMSKEGARFHDFQKRLLDLKNEGVLLAVVSKNNPEDALDAIRNHPDMVLREKDFVAVKANWDPKSLNLRNLARELNIGLDSFVFIDDNPVEREAVKIALPEVKVPDFPKDTSDLERFAVGLAGRYFPILRMTAEDRGKTEQYRTENKRESLRKSSATLEDYLASLEMKLTVREIQEEDVPRAAQLTQKTNQFNLTARRYTEGDIRRMMGSPDWRIWTGTLEDRFGDYGKVILAIAEIKGKVARIDEFLMSCRVMGRNVEADFLREIEGSLAKMGVEKVAGEYVPTQKNSVVGDFWAKHCYAPEADGRFTKSL